MKFTMKFIALLFAFSAKLLFSYPLSLSELGQVIGADTARTAANYSTLKRMQELRNDVIQLSRTDSHFFYPIGKKVFYPFGGSDVFFPSVLFPNSEKLVLVARESIKPIPQLDSTDSRSIEELRDGVNDAFNTELLRFSFIRTDGAGEKISNGIGMAVALLGGISALGAEIQNAVYYSNIICTSAQKCLPVATL